MIGWGVGGWGVGGWGAPGIADKLSITSALAIRENLVRIEFNLPVNYTDVRGLVDAADPKNFVITPVEGSIGEDGLPARPVSPVLIEQTRKPFINGRGLDIWLDRRMSPYPALYEIHCIKSIATGGMPLDSSSVFDFFGVAWAPALPTSTTTTAADIANPGYSQAIPNASQILGVYPVTDQGDYATDQGIVSFKKRIVRRLTTRRGAFAHLPGYGVGLLDEVKRLALPATRQKLAADAEGQIRQEPEALDVEVTITGSATNPGLFFFRVRVRTAVFGSVGLDIPVSSNAP